LIGTSSCGQGFLLPLCRSHRVNDVISKLAAERCVCHVFGAVEPLISASNPAAGTVASDSIMCSILSPGKAKSITTVEKTHINKGQTHLDNVTQPGWHYLIAALWPLSWCRGEQSELGAVPYFR